MDSLIFQAVKLSTPDMELLMYLLKVSVCSTLFFGFYLLTLKKLTFFKFNRFYLLITLCLSCIIPALHFEITNQLDAQQIELPDYKPSNQPIPLSLTQPVEISPMPVEQHHIDWYVLVSYGYLFIAAIILWIFVIRLSRMLKYIGTSSTSFNGLKLISKNKGFTNCSFFNYVFIDEKQLSHEEMEVLLKHEKVHAEQFHSVDKILMMWFKTVLWFNPIIYFYDKALEQTHEYEADQITASDFGNHSYARLLLRLAVSGSGIPMVHNFVKSPVKDRIKMLFQSKSKNMKKLTYLLAMPLALILVWGFTIKVNDVFLPVQNNEESFTLIVDAGHGGRDIGTSAAGLTEKELNLKLAEKIKGIAESKGLVVVLTRTKDEDLSFEKRAMVKGDFLISLHVNGDVKGTAKNGIEMFTSGDYSAPAFKLAKANSMTYYLYSSLRNLKGIAVSNKPVQRPLPLLDKSTVPGVDLELGYLTNAKDLNFIKDEHNQDEMANRIVDGVLAYRKHLPSKEVFAQRIAEGNAFSKKYSEWLNSDLHKNLTVQAARVKPQTISGKIESLHSFGNSNPTVDGFIMNANGNKYRVYIHPEQMKLSDYKPGDSFEAKVKGAEVWYDSEYPVLKPILKPIKANLGASVSDTSKMKIISYAAMQGKPGDKQFHLKNAVVKIGSKTLEAKSMDIDEEKNILIAKDAVVTDENNKVIRMALFISDLNGRKETVDYGSAAIKMMAQADQHGENSDENAIQYSAQDSVKFNKDKTIINLFGNANIRYKDFSITADEATYNSISKKITAKNLIFKNNKSGISINGSYGEFDSKGKAEIWQN